MSFTSYTLVAILLSSWIAPTVAKGQPPVCLKSDNACTNAHRKTKDGDDYPTEIPCGLYLAESAVRPGQLGLFTGVARHKGEAVGEPEIILPIYDARKNEWSPWMDMVVPPADMGIPEINAESKFINDVFVPGIGQMVACSDKYNNIDLDHDEYSQDYELDSAGAHRSKDATAGAFSYYHNAIVTASHELMAGEELVLPCTALGLTNSEASSSSTRNISNRKVLSIDFLSSPTTNAVCLDNLRVGKSTIPGAGRGAFAKRDMEVGQVIAPSPVLHFDRSQMEIVEQSLFDEDNSDETKILPFHREHGIRYTAKVKQQQLMLNYCFGQPDSNVLLLPYGPTVNFINHNEFQKANAYVRWYTAAVQSFYNDEENDEEYEDVEIYPLISEPTKLKSTRPMELFATPAQGGEEMLMIEYVALRDIEEGEEIFLYYGDDFVEALNEHVAKWPTSLASKQKDYISAAEWKSTHKDEAIRTEEEQKKNPYPENLETACYYSVIGYDQENDDGFDVWEYDEGDEYGVEHFACLRPCKIISRSDKNGVVEYSAVAFPMDRYEEPDVCSSDFKIPRSGLKLHNIPPAAVTVMDKQYTTDVHLPMAFRHEIPLPPNFLPFSWLAADPNPTGDFIPTPLAPGQMDLIHWKDNGQVVLQNAFRLGLSTSVRDTLLQYCDKMGITKLFRHVTVEDNGLQPGEDAYLDLQGYHWYLQRPEKKWYSNLHWLSPADEKAHEHYLQTLSASGFDDMLAGIGNYLGLDHLVVFHVTFIAVSQSTRGYVHTDVSNTGVRTFNIIVPLLKAKDSPPELDIQENEEPHRIGRYGYEYNVAGLMGDDSWHGTSAVDYRMSKDMRLAATIYVAEVTEDNVDSIMADYTQEYPPMDHDLLLSWAGRHWKRGDKSAKLPTPAADHILADSKQTAVN